LGFIEAKSNTSLFVFHCGANTVYLLLYADDIMLIASSTTLVQHTIYALKRELLMKDLNHLHHFLGVSLHHQADRLFLSQRQFTHVVLERVGTVDYKPVSTFVDMHVKVSTTSGPPVADLTQFRSLAGALQYLMFTHPDIYYVV
jgi:hypothetical protein